MTRSFYRMRSRFLFGLLAALAATAAACSDETPTLSGPGAFPPGSVPVTREVILPAASFFGTLGSFSGYSDASDATFVAVANQYQGALSAHTLTRFLGIPRAVTYVRNGATRTDSTFSFLESKLVMSVDTLATAGRPFTLQVWEAAQKWDRETATWTNAIDSTGQKVAWTEPGGTRGPLLGEGIYPVAGGDSLVVSSPPGTGQTQTAINTIGALVDAGKTVLVVGDRRASLNEVSGQLENLGLESILFQLSGNVTAQQLKAQLVRAIVRNEKSLEPQLGNLHSTLTEHRFELSLSYARLHLGARYAWTRVVEPDRGRVVRRRLAPWSRRPGPWNRPACRGRSRPSCPCTASPGRRRRSRPAGRHGRTRDRRWRSRGRSATQPRQRPLRRRGDPGRPRVLRQGEGAGEGDHHGRRAPGRLPAVDLRRAAGPATGTPRRADMSRVTTTWCRARR